MEKIFSNKWSIVVILGVIALTAFLIFQNAQRVDGAAFTGLAASVSSSTPNYSLAAGVNTLFASSTGCTARIISTQGGTGGVMLTFSDYIGQSPTGISGHYQAASTTEVYDSGLYGCGKVRAWSFTTGIIGLTETQ